MALWVCVRMWPAPDRGREVPGASKTFVWKTEAKGMPLAYLNGMGPTDFVPEAAALTLCASKDTPRTKTELNSSCCFPLQLSQRL